MTGERAPGQVIHEEHKGAQRELLRPEYTSDAPPTKSGVEGDSEPFETPFDRLRAGFDPSPSIWLGVVDVVRGVEAEEAVFVEVDAVAEDAQVPHAAGGHEDLLFGPA